MSSDDDMPDLAPVLKSYMVIECNDSDLDTLPELGEPIYNALDYAIYNLDSNAFIKSYIISNIHDGNVYDIFRRPILYPYLELLLSNDIKLCDHVRRLIAPGYRLIYRFATEINIQSLHIILSYLSTNELSKDICNHSIYKGNLQILDILFEFGYDIKSAFDKKIIIDAGKDSKRDPPIKFDIFIQLEKYGVNILSNVNIVCMIFCHCDDIIGLTFCLENGSNATDIITKINNVVHIDIIKLLLNYGAHLNKFRLYNIKCIMDYGRNFSIVKYLIENGLDVSNYVFDLIIYNIIYSTEAIIYFMDKGVNIEMINKLLPIACGNGNIESVNFLLENGADIHYDDDHILDFISIYSNNYNTRGNDKWFTIVKILIKNGAICNDPLYTFCLYAINVHSSIYNIDTELFEYFLNLGIDLNNKLHLDIKEFVYNDEVEYILDMVVDVDYIKLFTLCLKYGADPFINNHSPLRIAIQNDNLEVIKILLDMGSIVDSELDYQVDQSTIDLLDAYQINHKLTKIIKTYM